MLYDRRSLVCLGRVGPLCASSRQAVALDQRRDRAEPREPRDCGVHSGGIASLFASFAEVETRGISTPYDRRVAGPLVALTEDRLGWFHLIRATKALSDSVS